MAIFCLLAVMVVADLPLIMMSDDLIFMLHLDCTVELLMDFTGIISDPKHSEEGFLI